MTKLEWHEPMTLQDPYRGRCSIYSFAIWPEGTEWRLEGWVSGKPFLDLIGDSPEILQRTVRDWIAGAGR